MLLRMFFTPSPGEFPVFPTFPITPGFLLSESLEIRRLGFDRMYYYKVLANLAPLNPNDYFIIHQTNPPSRSYPVYLTKPAKGFNRLTSSFFFFRNANVFTDLAHDHKSATSSSLASFKNGLNSVDFSIYLKGGAFRQFF